MKANILISGSTDLSWLTRYEEAVTQSGGIPHAAYLPAVDAGYDGLLLAGGADVDPSYYGQDNRGSVEIDRARDRVELALTEAYLAAGKPILAICRGQQLLNTVLGGTLIQDLPLPHKQFHVHAQDRETALVHPIRATEGSILRKLYGEVFPVNSYHHQAVDSLGLELKITALSEGGLVEAMEHKSLPILCVQFHPERMTGALADPHTVDGGKIFDWFLAQCRA